MLESLRMPYRNPLSAFVYMGAVVLVITISAVVSLAFTNFYFINASKLARI